MKRKEKEKSFFFWPLKQLELQKEADSDVTLSRKRLQQQLGVEFPAIKLLELR